MVFRAFVLRNLKKFRLIAVDSFLNFCKAALRWLIAFLQSSLNQGVLCLFEAEALAMVSSVIEVRASVKCFVRSSMFGSYNNFCFQFSKLALFIFQWGSLFS